MHRFSLFVLGLLSLGQTALAAGPDALPIWRYGAVIPGSPGSSASMRIPSMRPSQDCTLTPPVGHLLAPHV